MATLLECPDCSHKVSMSATQCPSCGKHFGAGQKGVMYALAKQKAEARGEKFDSGGCFGATILICATIASVLALVIDRAAAFF